MVFSASSVRKPWEGTGTDINEFVCLAD